MASKKLLKYDEVRKERFVSNLVLGLQPVAAARASGFTGKLTSVAKTLMQDEYVRELIQAYRDELAARLHITRQKVVSMTLDAYDAAMGMGDVRGAVAAISELNKMHGYYAPTEIKMDVVSQRAATKRGELERMDDRQLLELASGEDGDGEVIDAEFVELTDEREDDFRV